MNTILKEVWLPKGRKAFRREGMGCARALKQGHVGRSVRTSLWLEQGGRTRKYQEVLSRGKGCGGHKVRTPGNQYRVCAQKLMI